MNESLIIHFFSQGKRLDIVEFQADQGITFDHHPDASPLNIALGIQPLLPRQLDLVRQRHDWRDKQFFLDATVDSGGLRFSGFKGDPNGLPAGPYDLTVELESFRFRDAEQRVVIPEGKSVEISLNEEPDLRRVQIRNNFDGLTSAVIADARSAIDGTSLMSWLTGSNARAARKACLLNVLSKLRVPPDPGHGFSQPLTSMLEFIFFADVDRIYTAMRPNLRSLLEGLVRAGLWAFEGNPGAAIHQHLRAGMSKIGVPNADKFTLSSYRQGGRNGLQIVVATPPAGSTDLTSYADVDIDLGNPLWDLEGLIVHTGELLDSGKTDHLALRSKFAKGATSDFLYYDLVQAQEMTA